MRSKSIVGSLIIIISIILLVLIIQNWDNISNALNSTPSTNEIPSPEEYINSGELDKALAEYTSLINSNRNLSYAYSSRGFIYLEARRYHMAIDDFTAALEDSRTPDILTARCNAYRLTSQVENATSDCLEAIEIDPNFTDAYAVLALLYISQDDINRAEEIITKANEINPSSELIFYTMHLIKLHQGDPDGAIFALGKSIELSPNNLTYYWDRAFLLYSNGRIDEAKADLNYIIKNGHPAADGDLMYRAGSLLNSMSSIATNTP